MKKGLKLGLFLGVVLISLWCVASVNATDWYVRPAGGNYGTEGGSSYNNAWDGLGNVVWGGAGVVGSDTLYICGEHLPPKMDSFSTHVGYLNIPSGSEGSHTIIRGDCPGDTGTIWGAYLFSYDSWADEGGDTYSTTLVGSHYRDWYFEDVTTGSYTLLDRETSLAACQANAGSFYKNGQTLYVHCSDDGNPTDRISFSRWGWWWSLAGKSYITVRDLTVKNFYRFQDPKGVTLHDITLQNLKVDYLEYYGFGFFGNDYNVIIDNCDISWAGNGIYLVHQNLVDSPYNFTISNNNIYNIGVRASQQNNDAHCIGIQGGHNNVIEGNYGYNAGSGVTFFAYPAQDQKDNTVRYNFFRDMHILGGANSRGIEFQGNTGYTADRSGNIVHHNIISNCEICLLSQTPHEAEWYSNVIYDCTQGFRSSYNDALRGPFYKLRNNIFLDNEHHILHVSGASTYNIDSDYNLFYPDDSSKFYYTWYPGRYMNLPVWQSLSHLGSIFDPHSIVADPLFVDPESGNFHLQPGSPAIDAGINVGLTLDFDGNTIPQGSAPDIGAYEYGGVVPPPPPPEEDTIPPTVTFFDVQPRTTTTSTTVSWTVTDNQDLDRVEVWRTIDSNGQPDDNNWIQIYTELATGTTDTGSYQDTLSPGTYWYGIHAIDVAENIGTEDLSIQVLVTGVQPPPVICGDGSCNGTETCSTCLDDCGCSSPLICCSGLCVNPVCSQNSHCGIDTSCTTYICNNPGTCSVSCSSKSITSCIDNDGCCPFGCDHNNDNDCKEIMGFWDFDEGVGSIVTDSSGNGNTGTIYGASWTTGLQGNALKFDGVGNYVDFGNDSSIQSMDDNFSVEIVFKAEKCPPNINSSIFSRSMGYTFRICENGVPNFGYFIMNKTYETDTTYNSGMNLTNNEWHHAVLVFNNKVTNLYFNGKLLNSQGFNDIGNLLSEKTLAGSLTTNSGWFNGILDQLVIYSDPLSAQEILDYYNDLQNLMNDLNNGIDTRESGNGGGGGGSGTSSISETTPSIQEIHSGLNIIPHVAAIIKDFDLDMGIKEITINVNNLAQNVRITVLKYDSRPANVSVSKTGKVYRYLQIETENLEDKLNNSVITIQIEKNWTFENNIEKENIAMFRFNESYELWDELTTNYTEEDETYYYYDVKLNSFSHFIIAEKTLKLENRIKELINGFIGFVKTYWLWILILVGVVVIATSIIYLIKRQKKTKEITFRGPYKIEEKLE